MDYRADNSTEYFVGLDEAFAYARAVELLYPDARWSVSADHRNVQRYSARYCLEVHHPVNVSVEFTSP